MKDILTKGTAEGVMYCMGRAFLFQGQAAF